MSGQGRPPQVLSTQAEVNHALVDLAASNPNDPTQANMAETLATTLRHTFENAMLIDVGTTLGPSLHAAIQPLQQELAALQQANQCLMEQVVQLSQTQQAHIAHVNAQIPLPQ